MDAEQAVVSLFKHHLALYGTAPCGSEGDRTITSFRDLFRVPSLATHAQKVRLIVAAERSACANVIMDVLLFVSQTMARDAFHRELAKAPLCQQHWIQYELAQQQQTTHTSSTSSTVLADAHRVAVEARVAGIVSTLLSTKTPPLDVAVVLLQLIFHEEHGFSLAATHVIATEVLRVVTRTKPYRLPQWTIDLLHEFVMLSGLQLETEQRDAFRAPPASALSAYFDKRARGANSVNANWRMRFVQLSATEVLYSKHDTEKLATSKNPFLDKRIKGRVALTKQLPIAPLNYTGKVSRRPYCIQIGYGDDALIVDTCTPVQQAQWMHAIAGNVRRLDLDPRWVRFPRPSVHGMSLHAFLRYVLLYHSDATNATASIPCDAQQLTTKFQIHEKRFLFASFWCLAQRGEWRQFETLAVAEAKPKTLFSKTTVLIPGTAIGYGAILDVATYHDAPLGLLSTLEMLVEKHDVKKPVWICHTKTSEGDGVAIDVQHIARRESRASSTASSTLTSF